MYIYMERARFEHFFLQNLKALEGNWSQLEPSMKGNWSLSGHLTRVSHRTLACPC
jgi:hypothetical protein